MDSKNKAAAAQQAKGNCISWEFPPWKSIRPWWLFLLKNRYARLVIYSIISFNARFYGGWQYFAKMLYKSGAYRWQCAPTETAEYCDTQYTSVQLLYTVGTCAEFSFSLVAGFLLDNLGPLLTGVVGQGMFFSGLIMIIFSTEAVQLYIPGMVLLAGSVNVICYPTLVAVDLFPSNTGLAVSILMGLQAAASLLTPVLWVIWEAMPNISFEGLLLPYLGCFVLPLAVWFIFALPVSRYKASAAARVPPPNYTALPHSVPEGSFYPAALEKKIGDDASSSSSSSEESAEDIKTNWSQLLKELLTPEWIAMTIFYVIQNLQTGYFPMTVDKQFGSQVAEFLGWFQASTPIWAIGFGFLVDYFTILPLTFVITGTIALLFGLALVPSVGLSYFTTIVWAVVLVPVHTVKYSYTTDVFAPRNFGLIVGIMSTAAGLLNLLNIPIFAMGHYVYVYLAYLFACAPAFLLLGFIYYRYRSGIRYHHLAVEDEPCNGDDAVKDENNKKSVEVPLETLGTIIAMRSVGPPSSSSSSSSPSLNGLGISKDTAKNDSFDPSSVISPIHAAELPVASVLRRFAQMDSARPYPLSCAADCPLSVALPPAAEDSTSSLSSFSDESDCEEWSSPVHVPIIVDSCDDEDVLMWFGNHHRTSF